MTISALRWRLGFSSDQRNASSISGVVLSVEKIDEYDFACTDSMNAMLVYTASSCGVIASGIRLTAPTVPWIVSRRVRPVKTRVVSCCSCGVSVPHDWMSLDSGIFSGIQKLPTRRSQTSASLSSSRRFQLMAWTLLTSLSFSCITSPSSSWPTAPRSCTQHALRSEHARDAVLDLGALERLLAQADVVQRLDALAPRVDLRLVDVARRDRVLEEQRQGQALVDVLGGLGVRVDDLLVADLVRVVVVLEVVVREEGRRVVDAPDLALLADLDLRGDRVDRRRRVVEVGDRARRRDSLEVLVVQAVLLDGCRQRLPVVLRRDRHAGVLEQLTHAGRLRLPRLGHVLLEVGTRRVRRVLEAVERLVPLDREPVRRTDRVVRDRAEVHVREVEALGRPVVHALTRQVAVQVHLPEPDRVATGVGALDRRHRLDARLVRDRGERPDRYLDRAAEVGRVHRERDVHRAE